MTYLYNIAISLLTLAIGAVGLYNYVPLSWLDHSEPNVGTTQSLTSITGSTLLSDLDTILTTNFGLLNDNKMEMSTTTLPLITTLSNLVTVGALASGSLTTGFTTVTVPLGGTGSTTLSSNQILLGNGTGIVKTVSGWGTSGQVLKSNGGVLVPSWSSGTVDEGINYDWTGYHTFTNASTTNASTTLLSVSGDSWFTGDGLFSSGLGVGTATTSDGNLRVSNYLQVDGTASTTNMFVSGTCTNCSKIYTYSTTTVAMTSDISDTVTTGFYPTFFTGVATIDAQTDATVICQFSSNGTNGHYFGNQTSATDQVMDTSYLCYSNQGNDDFQITISAISATGFTILFNQIAGSVASVIMEMIVIGY